MLALVTLGLYLAATPVAAGTGPDLYREQLAWTGGDGLRRAQPIWLDRNDELTAVRADSAAVLGPAVGAALFVGLCCLVAAVGGLAARRVLLDRRRAAGWTREWERFSGRPSRS